mgnify:CR=1 FL=1
MDNHKAAQFIKAYLEANARAIPSPWPEVLDAAYAVLSRPKEYVVQLENGGFLEAGDGVYIFPTLEYAEDAVRDYENYLDLGDGKAVVNLFQIIQARWDNGEPLT